MVTASFGKTARVWDADTGKPVGEPMTHGDGVNSASFSPDGQRVVAASFDKTARVWDADTGKPVGEPMTHSEWVDSASFSPDGKRVVTASFDKTARVWDADTGKPVGEPMTHRREVLSARFSPDGKRVVTASEDKTARVWNVLWWSRTLSRRCANGSCSEVSDGSPRRMCARPGFFPHNGSGRMSATPWRQCRLGEPRTIDQNTVNRNGVAQTLLGLIAF